MSTYKIYILSTLLIFLSAPFSLAQTTWDGGGADDNWFTDLNWDNDLVPNGTTTDVVVGAPAPVFLNGNVNINSLMVTADGVINLDPFRSIDFGGSSAMPLVNFGTISGANGGGIQLSGSVVNSGSMSVLSTGSTSDFEVLAGGATISGGGTMTLSGSTSTTRINGLSNPLLNIMDQTVQGYGYIGNNALSIDLQSGGTFDANVNGEVLLVDPDVGGVSNSGLMRSSGGGVLRLRGGTFDNTGGLIQATAGSIVELDTSADVFGGSIESTGDGTVEVIPFKNATVSDISIDANFVINNGSRLSVDGTIHNADSISATSESGSLSQIRVESTGATFDGGGTINLSGPTSLAIINGLGNPHLVIANQTIQGYGGVGDNSMTLELLSDSLIDANQAGETMLIDPNADGMINSGLIRASNGGKLLFRGGTIDNSNGSIQATADSTIELDNSSDITGGSMEALGDASIEVIPFKNASLSAISLAGDFFVNNGSTLNVQGIIDNSGTMRATAESGSISAIRAELDTTLDGGGTIRLSGATNRAMINGLGNPTLTVADQTIEGFGGIGANAVNFDFQPGSVIHANVDNETLLVDPIGDTFTNIEHVSEIRTTNGATLRFLGNVFAGDPINEEPGLVEVAADSNLEVTNLTVGQDSILFGNEGVLKRFDGGIGIGVVGVAGLISPGDTPLGSIGLFMVQNANLSFGGEARFEIESATSSDRILVAETAVSNVETCQVFLGGKLTIALLDGFTPHSSDQFPLISNVNDNEELNPASSFDNITDGGRVVVEDGSGSFEVFSTFDGSFFVGSVTLRDFQPLVLGDVNGDGSVNLLDVAPFIDAISSGTFSMEADVNIDGVVNLLDVDPFITLIAGG